MRAWKVPVLAVILAATPATPVLAAADLPAPVLAYEFDSAGPTITDSSGNGLDGTLVNPGTAVFADGALTLPGGAPTSNGAYVTIPRKALEGRTELTVATRVKWDGTTAPWQWIYALGKDNGRYLFSTPYNGDGRLRTAITKGGGGAESQVTGSAALPANAWKSLTVTLGGGRLTTYLDGVAVAATTTTLTAADLLDAGTTSAGFVGKSFYPDPLFDGAIDSFRLYGTALTADQVVTESGVTPPSVTGIAETAFDVRTTIGTAPALPATVNGTFTDGYDRSVPISWAPVDPARYAQRGTFTVAGTAAGRAVTATVTVIREGELVIDLADSTGPFHGGASGTLYGLYGDGVPTNNLIEGMRLRTVSTKAQDGPQHPGADALEVVKPLADSTGGDTYIYMTDIHRGFPYQWPGSTPAEKLSLFKEKIAKQVDQVLTLAPEYQDNVVFVPFNEPEGNMFGTGEWSYNGVSWLSDPDDYFQAWDDVYALIKGRMPAARIAGPNTSILFDQVKGFLTHTVAAGTVPDVITWHELSHPEAVRDSVAKYREWEKTIIGRELPININEYAFNYHTSVPGQMIQWISAIEESKVDADIAYWNIDGNLSDSAVQANRGNGQWWLYNAYGGMTGDTVRVTPPYPGRNYSLQGVASLDKAKKQARAIFGGATSAGYIRFDNVPKSFGKNVHAWIREIPWTGQVGDSAQPRLLAERDFKVVDGSVAVEFDRLIESSAYEIVLGPGSKSAAGKTPTLWQGSFEAEDAKYTGGGYSRNGPEGSPSDVSKFYTSGGFNVGGLRTGSDGVLDFTVDVPADGTYDLSVFANSLNTYNLVQEQGPTNVFLRVDGGAEQEVHLPLGYKWVVWDHADTTVALTKGTHTISLAAKSLDGVRVTKGDAIVDRITLALPNPAAATAVYEAELASLHRARVSDGHAELGRRGSATFWVYSKADAAAIVEAVGSRDVKLTVNGIVVGDRKATVSLSGGVNKVVVTGASPNAKIDRLTVRAGSLPSVAYEAEAATLAGTATVTAKSLAGGGAAVTGVTGASTLTFAVKADRAGTYALRIRYSNPEQAVATHYNPDPLTRHADLTINGGPVKRVLFPHSFHDNNLWELTVPVTLKRGMNSLAFSSAELPNFDGLTYASQTWPDVLLRSKYAPVIDRVTVAPYSR
ncbi:Ig-like domain-containing protein [Actinoplanes sichuanensis]|uniref:LamG-like jellyroll fold domain-containing protein n=1 Tax=Actinoplanes sichuanensis TaxID=512349 RepID=A0ABW4A264_9ACTN|nr:LamG-like jellyroll fold domain-containing protein [Actinoplanes sichuanensis]BEL12789.1 Ig-like domain-containing protein [Actinoplanes sichuanensis]